MKTISLALIIPAHNAEATLERCLQACKALQTRNDSFEIDIHTLVIDNASTDRTGEIAKKFDVGLVAEPNRGRAHARNDGARGLSDRYIAFIDADVVVEPDWALLMVGALEESDLIGGCESRLVSSIEQITSPLLELRTANFPMIDARACVYRKSAIDSVGGFDESVTAFNDIDFSRAVFTAGWMLACEPRATAHLLSSPRQTRDVKSVDQAYEQKWAATPNAPKFQSAIRYRGAKWGLCTFPHSFLLFNPETNEFISRERKVPLSAFLRELADEKA